MTDIKAIQTMNSSKHLYLKVAGSGANKHLEVTHKNLLGRFLMMLGFSSASMPKIAEYILEKAEFFKNYPIDVKSNLRDKMSHYTQNHSSNAAQKALRILNGSAIATHQEKASKLAQEIETFFNSNLSYDRAYARYARSIYKNMILALRAYAKSSDLSEKIKPEQPYGQGSRAQPETVRDTFKQALDPNVYGGMQQIIKILRDGAFHCGEKPENTLLHIKLAEIGERTIQLSRGVLYRK